MTVFELPLCPVCGEPVLYAAMSGPSRATASPCGHTTHPTRLGFSAGGSA